MLSFLPTPIGNLGDISFRTIEVLKDGEYILCEDTRVTKKLLSLISSKYNIDFPNFTFLSVHSHNEKEFLIASNIELLKNKNCIYMSDAGMPCVSDPGAILVEYCLENGIKYEVIPGANAILTAYASSGFSHTSFTFFGFLPHKGRSRESQLEDILKNTHLSILYESPHRLLKLLKELNEKVPNRSIFLIKEITKKYETRYKNSTTNIYNLLKNEDIKGEWVVIIEPIETTGENLTVDDIKDLKLPPKQKAKLLSKLTGQNIKDIYNNLIE